MKLELRRFEGEIPVMKGQDLPEYAAALAQNLYTKEGKLAPLRGLSGPVAALSMSAVKSIYRYSNLVWMSWQQDVNITRSPVVADPWDRLYWTGQGAPRYTHAAIATLSPPYPSNSLLLGVPAPETAPIVTLGAASGTNTDYDDDETRYYVCTYVNQFGEEGSPSPVSNRVVLVEPEQAAQLLLPGLMVNQYGITKCRIYRTASGSNSASFFLVAEIPISQTSLIDTVASDALGAPLATADYDMPPSDLKGLTMMANGILAGFVKNTIYLSESYLAYAWPKKYRLTTMHNIVAMAATTNALVVATEGFPYIVSGVSADSASSERIETNAACVSARSMVDMGEFVIYASPEGLIGVSGNRVMNLTEDIISPRQWKANYNPPTIQACAYDGNYLAFYQDSGGNKKGFVFNPQSKALEPITAHYPAMFTDLASGDVYVLDGSNICAFGTGLPMQLKWRSKPFIAAGNTAPNSVRIDGNQLNQMSLSILVNGVNKYMLGDCSKAARGARLPGLRGEVYQFEVTGTGEIERIILADSMEELV